MLRKLLVLLALLPSVSVANSHGIAIFGDLKYGADFTHFDYVNKDAPKGGKIKHAAIGSFDSLNSFVLKGNKAAGLGSIYDSLLKKSADENYSYYGLLAESVDYNKAEKYIAFKLRKNAKFNDGSKLIAQDIAFTFKILAEKAHPSYKIILRDIEKVEVIDELNIKFHLKSIDNRELPLVIGGVGILSEKFYKKHDFLDSAQIIPLGSGAYKISSFEPGKYIEYKRVDDYWGADLAVNIGQHNFDIIRYDYYRDYTVVVEALKSGEYDFRQENISKNWANAYDIDAVKDGRLIKKEIAHKLPTGMQAFVFNTRKEIFQDAKVREAISLAFDFEWTNKNIFYNAYSRTDSYFSNSQFAANADISDAEQKIIDDLSLEIKPFSLSKTNGSGNNRRNLRKATQLLKKAGYKLQDGVMTHPKYGKLEFEIILRQNVFERVLAPFIKNLTKIGVRAKMQIIDVAQYKKRTDEFDFDMMVNVYGTSTPGAEQRDYWHSENANRIGSSNYAGVSDKNIDILVEKIEAANDLSTLEAYSKVLDRILLQNHYVIPNWNVRSFRLLYWNHIKMPETIPPYGICSECWWSEIKAEKTPQN